MTSTNTEQQQFASEGFDLDAIPADGEGDDGIVLELGGGTTTTTTTTTATEGEDERRNKSQAAPKAQAPPPAPSEIDEAEGIKSRGNDAFRAGDYESALRLYGEAIDAVPTKEGDGERTGPELLEMKDEFDERVREARYQKQRREAERRRTPPARPGAAAAEANGSAAATKDGGSNSDESESDEDQSGKGAEEEEIFRAPPHRYSTNLSVYHSNRAACLLHMDRYEEAIRDADVALMYNPTYTKAYLRRMTAFEKTDKIEDALADARVAQRLEPTNRQIRAHVTRLEKLNEERLEKLKEETMGKLKDLGNSLLSNFGLSLDNFKTEKDPNTGSYNISFSNN